MDLQQLRCFLAVAREGHFGRAAERLHLTTSPVSRAVKDLERELGGDLFVRGYHQVELTAAGRHLLTRAEPIVADLDRVRSEVRRLADTAARTVRVGGTHLAAPQALEAVVTAAEKVDPERPLDVTLAPSAELLPALVAGELDLAVVHLPVADEELETLPLTSYRMTAVLRADDPLAARSELATADLVDHTLVTMADSVQPVAMKWMRAELAARGITRVETVPAADVLLIVATVRRRGYFAFVPSGGDLLRMFDDPRFVSFPVDDAPGLRVGVAWRRGDPTAAEIVAQLGGPEGAPDDV